MGPYNHSCYSDIDRRVCSCSLAYFNFRSSSTGQAQLVWGCWELQAGDGVCGQGAGRDLVGLHRPSRLWLSSTYVTLFS
ncbi:hypothetical protein E2C01_081638 [Portunus trituberculatus]|uniref:Uncharacterized protein n=1 Tax=Portunus trituberculatus TaxID=210409 RepID=A0A5B7ISE7_PORTR|nr:hypothetical protein [Portunus trituberculatus]